MVPKRTGFHSEKGFLLSFQGHIFKAKIRFQVSGVPKADSGVSKQLWLDCKLPRIGFLIIKVGYVLYAVGRGLEGSGPCRLSSDLCHLMSDL
jgi:hypothetical protein